MSVVGFDIGNENCVIAVAKQRGIDVLLNDESKRETPATVSFGEKQRFIGAAAAASATMHPKSTISQIKRLIGRNFKEPDVQRDLRLFPFETFEGPDGGIQIRLQYLGEIHTFTPAQILGMLLSHLKQITEANLKMPVSDCVIGIPSYFTDLQRRSYLDAAAIAGLRPLRLMHDCAATALGYGIYKTDFPTSSPNFIVFVDIGHCDTQVCIASFEKGSMKILSHAFDRNFGGRDFDEVLFSHFAAEFKEKYNINVYTNIKACIRLRTSCEKLKKVLSANADAPLNIECLMDEKDVKGFIKREEFEKLASELLERLRVPCQKALDDARMTVEDIHSVELVGSGSRIPAIAKILTSLFKREPSRTTNASECVARGCAVQCAMLSPIFRVRDYEVQDSFPFSVGVSSDKGPICASSNGVLFPKGQVFPSVKILTLHREGTFRLETFYANKDELPCGVSPAIGSFLIGPFNISHTRTAKVKVRVHINLHGILNVESASLIEDHADNMTLEEMECESDHASSAAGANTAVSNGQSSPPSVSPAIEPRTVTNMKKLEIPIAMSIFGAMTEDEVLAAKGKESYLAQLDMKMEQIKEKKNALESYVYDMRDKMLNAYRSFATESEREGIARNLQQTEDWLYDDGEDESEIAYSKKLDDLKRLIDPIASRYKDGEGRAQATRDLLKCIVDHRLGAESLPSVKRDAVLDECDKAEKWLQERTSQQDSLPQDADPALQSGEIKRKAEALNATCKYIMKSPNDSPGRKNSDDMQVD